MNRFLAASAVAFLSGCAPESGQTSAAVVNVPSGGSYLVQFFPTETNPDGCPGGFTIVGDLEGTIVPEQCDELRGSGSIPATLEFPGFVEYECQGAIVEVDYWLWLGGYGTVGASGEATITDKTTGCIWDARMTAMLIEGP